MFKVVLFIALVATAKAVEKPCNRCRGAGPIPSPTGDQCETCECVCGQVQCKKTKCDVEPPCPTEFWILEPGTCCPICKPCIPGEVVQSTDPCAFCSCTGEPTQPIICAIADCFCFEYNPHIDQCNCPGLYHPEGECCPKCPDCEGVRCPPMNCPKEYWVVKPGDCCASSCKACEEGDEIDSPDPCHTTCFCEDHQVKCSHKSVHCTCGVLDCQCDGLGIQDKGDCCPTCPPVDCRIVRCARPDCPEEFWFTEPNACCPRCLTKNECELFQIRCPTLPCPESNQVQGDDDCCPKCGCEHGPSSDPSNCMDLALVTDACGNKFCPDCIDDFDPNPDPCVGCSCSDGQWACYMMDCSCFFAEDDPDCTCPGLYIPPGKCCPQCAECEPNSTFKPDTCTTCTCDENSRVVGCDGTALSVPEGCPPSVWITDECGVPSCPVCTPGEAVPSNRPCNEGCFCNEDSSISCFELAIDCVCGFVMECTCPGLFIPEGQCCPICPEDCSLVNCPSLECALVDQVRDEGSCCNRCKSSSWCEGVTCNDPGCPAFLQVTWPGNCCPSCMPCEPNSTFKPDACTTCTCDENGRVIGCVGTAISSPEGCPPSVWITDECGVPSCPVCTPGESVPSNRPCNEGCFCNEDSSISCFELAIDCVCGFLMECTCPGLFTPEGQCCPICPEDCSLVNCPSLECVLVDQVRDEGSCCNRCKTSSWCEGLTCNDPGCPAILQITWPVNCCPSCIPCESVVCGPLPCPSSEQWTEDGMCCPRCEDDSPDCSAVSCIQPFCSSGEFITPAGTCCPMCVFL